MDLLTSGSTASRYDVYPSEVKLRDDFRLELDSEVAHGRLAVWLIRNRLVVGTILNIFTGYMGWFLKFDRVNRYAPAFAASTLMIHALKGDNVSIYIGIFNSLVSAIVYAVISRREINQQRLSSVS